MEPMKDVECTLVDVLDRLLDKGLILHADVIIHVAGVPLIGINLRAALAGIEIMLDYGMMEAWDESTRNWYAKEYAERKEVPLVSGEKIILKTYGSHYYNEGIYNTWRPGFFYLTNKRLFLFRKEPAEILFQTRIEKIKGLTVNGENRLGKEKQTLCLLLEGGKIAKLHTENIEELKNGIEKQAEILGVTVKDFNYVLEEKPSFLTNKNILQAEKAWYLFPASGIMGETWRPGKMYVTEKRLCWHYDSDEKPMFDIPIESITDASVERKKVSNTLQNEWVLTLSYKNGATMFLGKEEKLNRLKMAIENRIPLPVKA